MNNQSYQIIKNGTVITPEREIRDGIVIILGEKIIQVAKRGEVEEPLDAEIVDANNGYISPGLIDIHVNGAMGADITKVESDTFSVMGRFFVKNGIVYTHPADVLILNGITREIVLKLCRDFKIPYEEKAISFKNIATMNEAFLTGTSTQIASIKQFDDHKYYDGNKPGPITQKLQESFLELKKNYSPELSYEDSSSFLNSL